MERMYRRFVLLTALSACGTNSSSTNFETPVKSLSLNHESACVVDADGALYCWGDSTAIPGAQAYSGPRNDCVAPFISAAGGGTFGSCVTPGPMRLDTSMRFTKVSRQTAITTDGQLYMWPFTDFSQCDRTTNNCPSQIGSAGSTLGFKDVGEFDGGWCGITTDGKGYCGFQEGTANGTTWFPPAPFGASQTFTKISVSGNAYAVLDTAGKAWVGTFTYASGGPNHAVMEPSAWEPDKNFVDIVVQHRYGIPDQIYYPLAVCGITDGGAVVCSGPNDMGQRGTGTHEILGSENLSPSLVPNLTGVTSVGVGLEHVCATTASNQLYCWGRSTEGQTAGTAYIECRATDTRYNYCTPSPTLVTGLPPMKRVEASIQWTCGIAMDDTIYCWGLNTKNQLGGRTQQPVHVGE